jgi:hypothetical protein
MPGTTGSATASTFLSGVFAGAVLGALCTLAGMYFWFLREPAPQAARTSVGAADERTVDSESSSPAGGSQRCDDESQRARAEKAEAELRQLREEIPDADVPFEGTPQAWPGGASAESAAEQTLQQQLAICGSDFIAAEVDCSEPPCLVAIASQLPVDNDRTPDLYACLSSNPDTRGIMSSGYELLHCGDGSSEQVDFVAWAEGVDGGKLDSSDAGLDARVAFRTRQLKEVAGCTTSGVSR